MAKPTAPVAADKSLSMAYLLWAFGGPWGLHHIYLARYRHAFLWVTTMGGFLGIGWLRDVWRLPDYVAEYNAGSEYAERMVLMTKLHHKPPLSMARISAQLVFGCLVGVAVMAGLPQDLIAGNLGRLIMALLVPLCCALAVHLVANIGNQQSELKWPLGGAYAIGFLFSLVAEDPVTNVTRSTVVAIIATNWKGRKWRRTKYKKGSKSLFLGLTLTAVLYGALWLSALLHNAYVTTSDGQTVPLKDAIGNIMESDAWKHPIDTFLSMWEEFESTGFDGSWQEFIDAIDPEGERNALQVLGVPEGSSEKTLRAAYKELAKKYHPDRVSDPEKKIEQQQRFIEIQKAFDTLSTIRSRRVRANKVDRTEQQ